MNERISLVLIGFGAFPLLMVAYSLMLGHPLALTFGK